MPCSDCIGIVICKQALCNTTHMCEIQYTCNVCQKVIQKLPGRIQKKLSHNRRIEKNMCTCLVTFSWFSGVRIVNDIEKKGVLIKFH